MILSCSRTYLSFDTFRPTNIDSIIDDINQSEMLYGMNFLGFPNHEIQLKVGVPVVPVSYTHLTLPTKRIV